MALLTAGGGLIVSETNYSSSISPHNDKLHRVRCLMGSANGHWVTERSGTTRRPMERGRPHGSQSELRWRNHGSREHLVPGGRLRGEPAAEAGGAVAFVYPHPQGLRGLCVSTSPGSPPQHTLRKPHTICDSLPQPWPHPEADVKFHTFNELHT